MSRDRYDMWLRQSNGTSVHVRTYSTSFLGSLLEKGDSLSLFKIRHHLTPDVLKLLVHAHVFPHISYCLSVWGGASKCRLNRVQKCVNFAARLVTGVRRCDHTYITITRVSRVGGRQWSAWSPGTTVPMCIKP